MNTERNIRRTVLPSGLIVLTERMEHVRSVAMGVWMRAGSRHEVPELNGISHFVEHMVFKGTKSRSAQRIAREVDAIGGNLDAFTGKETICFNIKVLDEHVPTALDVLSDLVLNPVFAAEEIARERGVILEEIKMDEDSPDTLVHEIFTQNFWKGHPLGKPILGTRETVRSFEQNTLVGFFEQRFQAGNMVFSAAGNIEHDSFVEQVARSFSSLAPGSALSDSAAPTVTPRIHLRNKKSLEQVQLCRDTGSLCVYAGTSSDRALQVIDLVMEEFRRLKTEPLQPGELRRAQDQLKGNLLLSLESSMSRMSNLARQQMYFERFFGLDEIIERVEAVTEEDVMGMASSLFQPERVAVTLLGRLDGLHLNRSQLVC